jgi:hypothetical protein
MKYFLDTEFIERGSEAPIELLSIGIVAEDNREYYAVVDKKEVSFVNADPWIFENVIRHLDYSNAKTRAQIKNDVLNFVSKGVSGYSDDIEFWGYYSDYDWVVFCGLFGRMIDLPRGFPMYCLDIKQLAHSLGNPRLPVLEKKIEHHALWDAREMKFRYEWLVNYAQSYEHDWVEKLIYEER